MKKRRSYDMDSPDLPSSAITREEYYRKGGFVDEPGATDSEVVHLERPQELSPQDRLPDPADGIGLTIEQMTELAITSRVKRKR